MSTPYLSEIKLVSFNFAPRGWAQSNGQLLPINQNQALFSLLGTTYGGDGRVNFGLPNLQGRAPLHVGGGHTLGQLGGEYNHTLNIGELPTHSHLLQAVNANSNSADPAGHLLSNATGGLVPYLPSANLVTMAPAEISNTGGSQPHANQSPYLVMNWIIALQGIFPSQN
jgi:microcystin-dependent protein